nr:MAG TPA: hypothetical protein [Caudoviricetes sp.]
MANEIRIAGNKIELVGAVKEHKLNKGTSNKDGKTSNYINGSLVLACGNDTEIELKVFVNELTNPKDGSTPKVRKNYEILSGIIDKEYPTMVDDAENPTALSVYGNGNFTAQLKEERYANQTRTECSTRISCDLGFGNFKVVTNDVDTFRANFDIEAYVSELVDEVKGEDEEETGRVIVKCLVPTSKGDIFPISLIAGDVTDDEGTFNMGEVLKDEGIEGETINFWGDINFGKIIERVKKGGSMGRAKFEEKTTYVHELTVVGAERVADDKAYEDEDIEMAMKQRTIAMEEVLTKAKEKDASAGSAPAKGRGGIGSKASTGATAPTGDKPKKRTVTF